MAVKAQNNVRITSYYDGKDEKSYYLTWDIKTGKSVIYSWNGTQHKYVAFSINLPAQPVPGAKGNIMFDAYYDAKDGTSYYLAWDTKTGKSVQYSWSGSAHGYVAFTINLPENPLPNATGDIMMKAYYDPTDNKSYYVVYDTNGGKSIIYSWNGGEHKYAPLTINLPDRPLEGK